MKSPKQQVWATKGFHIIDNFELTDGRASGAQGELFPSKVFWNKTVFESFQAGYLKSIDYELYLKLKHPTAKRMYRFLSKRMYHRPDWTFDLRDLAFEHVGLIIGKSDLVQATVGESMISKFQSVVDPHSQQIDLFFITFVSVVKHVLIYKPDRGDLCPLYVTK